MKHIVEFNNQKIELIKHKNSYWMTSNQLAIALGYSRTDIVGKLFNAHKDEFTDKMSDTTELVLPGNLRSITRIFSLRGCRMMGFFARTKTAVKFRQWVLDLIELYETQNPQIEVQSYTRSLPSGKKEIVLSEKAKAEIGGIFKACMPKILKDEFRERRISAEGIDKILEYERIKTEESRKYGYMLSEDEKLLIEHFRKKEEEIPLKYLFPLAMWNCAVPKKK